MTTYAPYYAAFFVWGTVGAAIKILNVTHVEETIEWRGNLRPSFDGQMLSTLHSPKRRWHITAEFDNANAIQSFLGFIGAFGSITPEGSMWGLREMGVGGLTTWQGVTRATNNVHCYVKPTAVRALDQIVEAGVNYVRYEGEFDVYEF
jgi:hypothetical protein